MPLAYRTLTATDVARVSAAMFAAPESELFGVELEWPVHRMSDVSGRPSAEEAAAAERWALPAASRITFEPGGQVELSTQPASSVTAALRAAETDSFALQAGIADLGLAGEILALDDRRPPRRVLQQPRYKAMERYFKGRWPAGEWMMCNTASTQVNISHDTADPHSRWHTMHLIAPVLIAAFANSSGLGTDGQQWVSLRQAVWWAIDPQRTRPVPLDRAPGLAWMDYALGADVMYISDEGCSGSSGMAVQPGLPFGRWMADGHVTGWPTAEDYRYHLTTLFPPVRPRGWLELRVLDALPDWIRDVAVLSVAAACTAGASRDLRRHMPETGGLWVTGARDGLAHPVLGEAARVLMAVVADHIGSVSPETRHAELVEEFSSRYVRRGICPGSESARRPRNLHGYQAPAAVAG